MVGGGEGKPALQKDSGLKSKCQLTITFSSCYWLISL